MSVTKQVTTASQGKKVYYDLHFEATVHDGREGMVAAAGGGWLAALWFVSGSRVDTSARLTSSLVLSM